MNGRELNKEFVDNALVVAGLSASDHHKDYAARRLEEGSQDYGETQYRSADCAAEAAEEAIDGCNWLGFEYVNRHEEGDLENAQLLTFAASHMAQAFEIIRQYLELRDSG
jgi:hypothetical protein